VEVESKNAAGVPNGEIRLVTHKCGCDAGYPTSYPGPRDDAYSLGLAFFAGSFEEITDRLEDQAFDYLVTHSIGLERGDIVMVLGTYSDSAVVCAHDPYASAVGGNGFSDSDDDDQDEDDGYWYYKIAWMSTADGPAFMGNPVEVRLQTTIQEKAKELFAMKT